MARKHEEEREYPKSGLEKVEAETRPKAHSTPGKIKEPPEALSETFSLPEKLRKLTDD